MTAANLPHPPGAVGNGVEDDRGERQAPQARGKDKDQKASENTTTGIFGKLKHAVPLLPPVAVGLASWVSHWTYLHAIPCSDAGDNGGCTSALRAVSQEVDSLSLAKGATLAAYDVSARFAWQSTLVLFLMVAALVAVVGACLAYRAIDESKLRGAGWFVGVLGVLAAVVFTIVYNLENEYLLLTDMLLPLVDGALTPNRNPFPTELIESTQKLFRAAAFTASGIVVIAAGTTLLRRAGADALQEEEHLVSQWRRLKHALFAGAALLVSAVIFQAAFFGWAHAFTTATTREVEQDQRAVLARAAEAKAILEGLKLDQATAHDRLAAEVSRLRAARIDTASAAGRQSLAPLRRRLDAVTTRHGAQSVRSDSLRSAIPVDTARVRIAAARVSAAEARIAQITTAGVSQAGGLVNSVLLLVMYLSAALILMERARTMSMDHGSTETQREQWLAAHGISLSFWSQWTRTLAVLAPALSSIPAAKLILDLFK